MLSLLQHSQPTHPKGTMSLESWVMRPRWAPTDTAALEGKCRGTLLDDWAANIGQDFGPSAVHRIREGLQAVGLSLPDSPRTNDWYPVGTQLRMMEILLDDIAGRDITALRKFLMKRLFRHRILRFMARRYGLKRILGQADGIHRQCYDVGHASSVVRGRRAQVTSTGSELVRHPTWQLLQLVGYLTIGNLVGTADVSVSGRLIDAYNPAFVADIVWDV